MWSYAVIQDGLIYMVDLRNGLYVLKYRGAFEQEVRAGSGSWTATPTRATRSATSRSAARRGAAADLARREPAHRPAHAGTFAAWAGEEHE